MCVDRLHQDGETLHPYQRAVSFFQSYVEKSVSDGAAQLEDIARWLEECSHSSAFSGVAAPETSLLCLHLAVQALMPERQAGVLLNLLQLYLRSLLHTGGHAVLDFCRGSRISASIARLTPVTSATVLAV